MSTVARRHRNPLAEVLEWLESEPSLSVRGGDRAPYIPVEDYVEEGTYVLRAEMPGIDPDKDVSLTVQDGILTIQAERQEETRERNRREFQYGSFTRSIALPAGTRAEDVQASYVDGVLELRAPVEGETEQPTRIPVQRPES
jgi:HSP20 family molecular chaperone IbpA